MGGLPYIYIYKLLFTQDSIRLEDTVSLHLRRHVYRHILGLEEPWVAMKVYGNSTAPRPAGMSAVWLCVGPGFVQELERQHEEVMKSQDVLARQQEEVLEQQAQQIASLDNSSKSVDKLVETAVPVPCWQSHHACGC